MEHFLIAISLLGLNLPQLVFAQGSLFVSTLGQAPVGSRAIGSDAWIAQSFMTGTNAGGYALNSIQLLMNPGTASPSGFSLSVYNKTGDPHSFGTGEVPKDSLAPLAGPDPAGGGSFTYSASSLYLAPSTCYFVVATAASPVAQGAYSWSGASGATGTEGPGDRWFLNNAYLSSANGSTWTLVIRQYVFQMGLYGTPVPEPPAFALWAIALASFGLWRRLHRSGKCGYDE
jgi:hypothetical protein